MKIFALWVLQTDLLCYRSTNIFIYLKITNHMNGSDEKKISRMGASPSCDRCAPANLRLARLLRYAASAAAQSAQPAHV